MNSVDPYKLSKILESGDMSGAARMFLLQEDIDKIQSDPEGRLSGYPIDPKIFSTILTAERADFNFIIESSNFALIEHAKLAPHLGDRYSHYFFGKSPIVMNIGGKVFMTAGGYDKHALTVLYRDIFRLKRVAQLNTTPCMEVKGCMSQGAMLNLNIRESSSREDVLNVSFEWLVYNAYITNDTNKSGITSINWAFHPTAEKGKNRV